MPPTHSAETHQQVMVAHQRLDTIYQKINFDWENLTTFRKSNDQLKTAFKVATVRTHP